MPPAPEPSRPVLTRIQTYCFWRRLNGRKRVRIFSNLRRRWKEGFWRGGFGWAEEAAHAGFSDAVLLG